MRSILIIAAATVAMSGAAFAAAATPYLDAKGNCHGPKGFVAKSMCAKPAAAPAGKIICTDGYAWPGTTTKGACAGHKGIKK